MALSNANTSGAVPLEMENSVLKDVYAIKVHLLITSPESAKSYESHKNEDSVTDFLITSSQEFNGIAPGSSLNQLFLFRKNGNQFSGITSDNYSAIFSISEEHTMDNYLLLTHPPDIDGNYTFHLSATFSDERILSDSITVNLY